MIATLEDGPQRQLVQFVNRYSQGPACLLVGCNETSGPLQVKAHNEHFNLQHVASLQELASLGELSSSQSARSSDTEWTFTQLDEGVLVCIGTQRLQDLKGTPDVANTEVPLSAKEAEEAWFQYWSELEVPDISREDLDAHLQILRNVNFAATALGSIGTWSAELLSAFTHCLASPHPVCMAWGEKDRTLLYNQPYSLIIGSHKHPRILGLPYVVAFEEAADVATVITNKAFTGRSIAVKNGITYLERTGYMEETYFSWSLVPIVHAATKAVLGFDVAVFEAPSVITDRRMKFLRKADQAIDLTTTPTSIFQRTCAEAFENVDLPLLAFYEASSVEAVCVGSASNEHGAATPGQSVNENMAPGVNPSHSSILSRAAVVGAGIPNRLFSSEIDIGSQDQTGVSAAPSLARHLRKVHKTGKSVVIQGDSLSEYLPFLRKTLLDNALACIVLLPIVTGDNILRAVMIAGLNPRKQYDEDYQLFLQLLQGQVTQGVASVRLIQEKLERSAALAALTAQKNQELRSTLEARTYQLQQTEQQFRNVLEKSPVAICTLSPEGLFTWANPSWWRITGHPTDEPPDNWPRHINEEDLHIPQKLLAQALDITQTIEAVEFRWKRKPGDVFDHWTWADLSRNLDENGNIKEVIAVLIDHTDKKNLEKILETRADEAIEMRNAQERFIDMTSHDMLPFLFTSLAFKLMLLSFVKVRNPLSAISLSADASVERMEALLKPASGTLAVEAHQEDINETLSNLKIINHCCMHITRLIDDILTLSKLDNKFLVVTPVPCRPIDFITETFSIFKAEMLAKDIDSTLDIRPSVMASGADYILADPSRISQLLINLLTNGIKFTAPSDLRQITVTLDCSRNRPMLSSPATAPTPVPATNPSSLESQEIYLLVSIADTGCGLSEEEISGLFQRFKQANPKTHISYGGSGLGLFVCRRLVGLLGGEIGVTSQVGKGSVFSFYVPVTPLAAPGTESQLETGQIAQQLPNQRGQRPASQDTRTRNDTIYVLVVEDNLINQKLLDKHLSRMGCVTTCANNGQEALDTIKQSAWGTPGGQRIDIVLMDIEMPVMSGLEAIQEIRRLQSNGTLSSDIPVLAVTANARTEQIATMLASGFDGTVSKPFKMPIIMDRMRKELLRFPRV